MKFGGLLFAGLGVRGWMSTLDYKAAFYDPTVDPVDPRYRGQKIYIFWHENISLPALSARALQPGDAAEPASRRRHPDRGRLPLGFRIGARLDVRRG